MQAELLFDAQATLGEGPAWDEKSRTLYWVDILAKRVHAWKDGRDDFLQLDEFIGCLAPRRDGGLVAALHASFWTIGGDCRDVAMQRLYRKSLRGFEGGQGFFGKFDVVEDFLHIIKFLNNVNQAQDSERGVGVEFEFLFGDQAQTRIVGHDACLV